MPKYLNNTVVGIDVASAFSFASILSPDESQFRKPFKVNHTVEGFTYLLEQIKKSKRRVCHEACILHGVHRRVPPYSFPLS